MSTSDFNRPNADGVTDRHAPIDSLPAPDPSGGTAIAAFCAVAEDPELCNQSLRWLSSEEQERAACFRFDRDRCVYVAAHLLLRRCLHQATGRADWSFRENAFGKPELSQSFGILPLNFNLTHTAGLAACALVHGHVVGIDAEALDRGGDHLKLAWHHFSQEEIEVLTQTSSDAREEKFLTLWTAKEAVIKASGRGLQMPLDSFSVDICTLRVTFHDGSSEQAGLWALRGHKLPGHHLALAVRAAEGLVPPSRIEWHQTTWADLLGRPPTA